MSEPAPSLILYRVIPSKSFNEQLRILIRDAFAAGVGRQALDVINELQYRLSVYPQFGEPLKDLHQIGETLWIACIPPLVFRYVIDEPLRTVFISARVKTLLRAGFS